MTLIFGAPSKSMTVRTCAIHQPNFFPWLGYFDKIRKVDIFVFLDGVDYPRSGSAGMGSWTNRVKIDIQGQAKWFGCPVERFSATRPIKDVKIAPDAKWRDRALKTLTVNYRRAPAFERAMAVLTPLILSAEDRLADYNIHAITSLCSVVGIAAKFTRQSEIGVAAKGTELLVRITRAVGAETYLCGGGASGYQDDELFAREHLSLVYQNFKSLPYGSRSVFLPGLSIIDFLMWSEDWRLPE